MRGAAAAMLGLIWAAPVWAEEERRCDVRDASAVISLALCEEGLSEAALSAEGKAICDGRMPCGVWFWTDAADMPATAPANHDGLTQAEVTSSLGVWVGEQEQLVTISPVD